MAGIVIHEQDLARLSQPTRRELLALVAGELPKTALTSEDEAERPVDWKDEDDLPYPLGLRDAKDLVRGLSDASRNILRVFCRNVDGAVGYATAEELMAVSGHDDPQRLGKAMSGITRRLRSVTGQRDAWIIDWLDEDRVWDPERGAHVIQRYIIEGPSLRSLCQAFGMSPGGGTPER